MESGWFALKINLEKAYNRVVWSFVRDCLIKCQLSMASVNIIMKCVTSACLFVSIDGRRSESFRHSRVLRQGDPMCPYLFNIYQALSKSILSSFYRKEWTPFWIGRKKVHVSHLLFADELLLFGRVDEDTAYAVHHTLDKFYHELWKKVNELKSKLIFSPKTSRH